MVNKVHKVAYPRNGGKAAGFPLRRSRRRRVSAPCWFCLRFCSIWAGDDRRQPARQASEATAGRPEAGPELTARQYKEESTREPIKGRVTKLTMGRGKARRESDPTRRPRYPGVFNTWRDDSFPGQRQGGDIHATSEKGSAMEWNPAQTLVPGDIKRSAQRIHYIRYYEPIKTTRDRWLSWRW